MSPFASFRRLAVVAIGSFIVFSGYSIAAEQSAGTTYPGYTTPSEQRGLNFNAPGVITKVFVKEGDFVKAGTLVAEQDHSVEDQHLAGIMVDVDSELQIEAAQQQYDEKRLEYDKKLELQKLNFGGLKLAAEIEVEEAKVDMQLAEARVKLAVQERHQKAIEAAEERAKIAQKKLLATTDGIVQAINVHEGELTTNDPKVPVIAMVTNEPLYVEIDLPIKEARALQPHQKLQVSYEDEPQSSFTAEVVFINPVAIPTTRQQHVRLQLENPNHYRSGLGVLVKLGEKMAAVPTAR